jgi:DNA invertase Pin-like site-specific DNA recombinase
MIRQRINAGLKRAVAEGKQLGRPQIEPEMERKISAMLAKGVGINSVARTLGVGNSVVERIRREHK